MPPCLAGRRNSVSAHSRDITATPGPKPIDFPLLSLQGPREEDQLLRQRTTFSPREDGGMKEGGQEMADIQAE